MLMIGGQSLHVGLIHCEQASVFFCENLCLGYNQQMVCIAVSTEERSCLRHSVGISLLDDDKVKLVPVTRSWMAPRNSVLVLAIVEGVRNTQVVISVEF